jgi:hypothetical protein
VLSAQAPDLAQALERAMADGVPCVILDGKVLSADRCTEKALSLEGRKIDVWYSGKGRRHGANVQAVMLPGGLPVWSARPSPGPPAT